MLRGVSASQVIHGHLQFVDGRDFLALLKLQLGNAARELSIVKYEFC